MSKDSILGKAKEIVGTLQESLGNAIHSEKTAAGGLAAQEAGRNRIANSADKGKPKTESVKN